MSEAVLIFPHHCFPAHPALHKNRLAVLIEDSLFFGDPVHPARFHQQKLVLHRSTLKSLESRLQGKGHHTRYVEYQPGETIRHLIRDLARQGIRSLYYCDPVDFILSRRIREEADRCGLTRHVLPSPLFLNTPEENAACLSGKRPLMAAFYTAQRRRLGILLDPDGGPAGGKWSFDNENRKPLPQSHQPPSLPAVRLHAFDEEAITYVERHFPDNPGKAADFRYPTSPRAASAWLESFLDERFALFGDYEDALSSRHPFLYHSVLTPLLNTGLISPATVVEKALARARTHRIPLNALEGFIRQIIGWREFMRAMYDLHGTAMRTRNFWNFSRPMPRAFYEASTGIPPVDLCIRRVLDHAYSHHIERLMVIGNFMLLCRIHPDDVYRWFMELYIDAYDWVMVPNVYAMSQFADGGLFTTKPYLSGSNYIRKMSDFPQGEWCETWDGLFWTFIGDHHDFFTSQPRLSMMARTLEKMSPDKRRRHRKNAEAFLARL